MAMKVDTAGFERVRRDLKDMMTMPQKAAYMAMKDAFRSTRSQAFKVARKSYNIKLADQKKMLAQIKNPQFDGQTTRGELVFEGGVGDPLRYFPGKPPRKEPNWKGINPLRRKPVSGASFKVRKGGRWTLRQGPKSESTFWFTGRISGAVLIGYRAGQVRGQKGSWKGAKVSTKGLFGASSIQAIGKKENYEVLQGWLKERYEKRFYHYMDVYSRGIIK